MKKALYVFCRVVLFIPLVLAGLVAAVILIAVVMPIGLMVQQ